jgi:hypothetical protein
MRQSTVLIVGGLVVGVGMVQVADVLLSRVLFGIRSSDATAIAAAAAVLLVSALGACLPAAWRAMHVDPAEGLRAE